MRPNGLAVWLKRLRAVNFRLSLCLALWAFLSVIGGAAADTCSEGACIVAESDLATERSDPFTWFGKPFDDEHPRYGDYKFVIPRFDSPVDCLRRGARNSNGYDILQFDWNKIGTRRIAEVCLFRIFRSLENTDDVLFWLHHHQFKTVGPSKKSPGHVGRDQMIINNADIMGTWSAERYREHSPSLLSFLGLEVVKYYYVLVQLDQNQNAIGVNAGTSIK